MYKVGLLVIALLVLFGCSAEKSAEITIENPTSADRINEMITVSWESIAKKLVFANDETFIILDESGMQVPYQVLFNGETTPQKVLFSAFVTANGKAIYSVKKGQPLDFERKTYGRSVPERKDDFAWENDRIAFRMYGPALASENPSNGVDIWLKKTDKLVLDKFYSDELQKGHSYHVDYGLGLDCYKVAHTLGAGGVAPFVKDSLWVGGHYATAKVLDSGILRTSFALSYDSVLVDGKILTQKLTITLDAYSQLNKAVVSYDGDFDTFQIAAGMWLHKEMGNMSINKDAGYVAYGENAVSDAGLDSGRDYVGVIFPGGMTDAHQHNAHLLGFADYKKGDQFTYYFGAGWNQWGFDTDEDWFDYINNYAAKLKHPLQVTVE